MSDSIAKTVIRDIFPEQRQPHYPSLTPARFGYIFPRVRHAFLLAMPLPYFVSLLPRAFCQPGAFTTSRGRYAVRMT